MKKQILLIIIVTLLQTFTSFAQTHVYELGSSSIAASSCGAPYTIRYSPFGGVVNISWNSTGNSVPTSITVELNFNVNCANSTTQNVNFNNVAQSPQPITGGRLCVCDPTEVRLTTWTLNPSNYIVGGQNTISIPSTTNQGIDVLPGYPGAYARVTVRYSNSPGPEINIKNGTASIVSGDITPASGDRTQFGSLAAGTTLDRTFTIENEGTSDLTLSGSPIVTVSGSSAFSIQTQPASNTIAASASQTFVVRFNPTCTQSGLQTAVISIASNDTNETPYTFTVQGTGAADNVNPTIATLPTISVNADAGVCTYASSQLTKPTAADNCIVSSVIATPASLVIGANTVTWTATDGSGLKATSIQTVTVVDNVKPTAISKNITVQLNASGSVTVNAADLNNGSTDNCSISNYKIGSGHIGTVCDMVNEGNVLSLTAPSGVFTKVDFASYGTPTGTCGNYTTGCNASNSVSTVSGYLLGKSSATIPADNGVFGDPCGGTRKRLAVQATYGPATGSEASSITYSCADLGTKDVTLYVTDGNGNVSTVSATITIEDKIAATVLTQNITVQLDATGNATIAATDVDNSSTDACGIATLALDTTSFNCSNVGANTVTLTATDVNGNVSSETATITIEDKIAATVLTQNITVQLDATGNATIAASDVDNGSTDACGIATLTLDTTSFNCSNVGANTVTLTATDVNGNVSSETATVTIEDKIGATVLTKNITVQLDATGNAAIAASDVDNGSTDACGLTLALDTTSFNCSNVGANTVTLTATDANGNISSETATVTIEDKIAATVLTKNITVQLDATGNATIAASDVDNSSTDACGIATLALDTTSFNCSNVGANTVTLTATDANGNVSSETATVTIEDKIAATVLTKNITVQLDATGNATIAASDVDNGSTDACGLTLALDTASFNCSNVGANTVTLTATDANGNVSAETATVTIEDKIAATVLTKNITVQLDATGNATIAASDVDNGSTDACGLTLALDTTSFNCSNVGANTVTLTATDANGNVSSETATVTIEDKIAPIVSAKNITIQLDATGNATITGNDVDNASSDVCNGILTYSVSPNTFNCSNVGANNVTLTVTDASGNFDTATATVTIEDKTAPIVVTKNITIHFDTLGNASIAAADVNDGSTTVCGGTLTFSVSPSTFTCANAGANTVTLTATGANGEISSATATVTILENILPTVLTKDITVELDEAGNVSVAANQVNNGSSDNCGIGTMTLSKTSFDCTNVGVNTVVLTVVDKSGNTASANAKVTVVNTFGDNDNDGILDNCDPDDDNDGVLDSNDNCPITANPYQEDRNNNGIGDTCDKEQMNISEAFTPNGDGINDTWVISNIQEHPNSTVRVFNRWGAEVFIAKNYQNDWDGQAKGQSGTLPAASSYYYQIDLDGNGTIDRQGWIYINR